MTANGLAPAPHPSTVLSLLDRATAGSHRPPAYIATGFAPLDDVLGGVRTGELLVVGGRPGEGKTIVTLQWARAMAKSGHTAVVASYEHDEGVLLSRLLTTELGELAAEDGTVDAVRLERLRRTVDRLASGELDRAIARASDPLLALLDESLAEYADRLVLVRASGATTDLDALTRLVDGQGGPTVALFVDYLQKVPLPGRGTVDPAAITEVVGGLKELALSRAAVVVGVAAADLEGLGERRLRLRHLRGAEGIAYEADAAVLLNDKLAAVSPAHLAYDTTRADTFSRWTVFSVEKNRRGAAGVDLEFEKDFANHRFHADGQWVSERLWDDRETFA